MQISLGERDGPWTFCNSNGQLEKKGKYENSVKEVWEIYWNNGRLFRKGRHMKGKNMVWNDYHENVIVGHRHLRFREKVGF